MDVLIFDLANGSIIYVYQVITLYTLNIWIIFVNFSSIKLKNGGLSSTPYVRMHGVFVITNLPYVWLTY